MTPAMKCLIKWGWVSHNLGMLHFQMLFLLANLFPDLVRQQRPWLCFCSLLLDIWISFAHCSFYGPITPHILILPAPFLQQKLWQPMVSKSEVYSFTPHGHMPLTMLFKTLPSLLDQEWVANTIKIKISKQKAWGDWK